MTDIERKILIVRCVLLAIQECQKQLDTLTVKELALDYGRAYSITVDEIETVLRRPLAEAFDME